MKLRHSHISRVVIVYVIAVVVGLTAALIENNMSVVATAALGAPISASASNHCVNFHPDRWSVDNWCDRLGYLNSTQYPQGHTLSPHYRTGLAMDLDTGQTAAMGIWYTWGTENTGKYLFTWTTNGNHIAANAGGLWGLAWCQYSASWDSYGRCRSNYYD